MNGAPVVSAPQGPVGHKPSTPSMLPSTVGDMQNTDYIYSINLQIDNALEQPFLTRYIALERVRKVLTVHSLSIPSSVIMADEAGEQIFSITQWGGVFGKDSNGSDVDIESVPNCHLYFAWADTDDGMVDVFASVVNDKELEELLNTDI